MPKRHHRDTQLDLFRIPAVEPQVVSSTAVPPALDAVAGQLPRTIYLGTSSWTFPGWQGIVYDRAASASQLARHGLAAYSRHPLLRAVGIDRTYYAPITATEFAAYAAAVPDTFRFLVKAHALCTHVSMPRHGRAQGPRGEPNARFLDATYATEQVIAPCVEGLGAKLGPLLFQFPPQDIRAIGGAQRFAERLHAFLKALPRGLCYAVEVRNTDLLIPAYAEALADAGVCHCYNIHPRVPGIHDQQRLVPCDALPALVVRWMLHPTMGYDEARGRYEPFDRLIATDPSQRTAIAAMCLDAVASERPAFVIVNNKAEGSAPLSVFGLAECIVQAQHTTV